VIVDAVKEVGGPSFFALLVIAVSFLPVLALEAQEGRLFKPLAYTKSFTMVVAAVLAITLDPVLRLLFGRPARIRPEESHPLSRLLIRLYEPVCALALRWKYVVILGAFALVAATWPVYRRLGSEFMPPLDEGALLYMPSTLPGISAAQAQRLLQAQDRMLMQFPEVERVLGKAGRAETSTDPAPLSMAETIILLKPKSQWRAGLTTDALVREMNEKVSLPGAANAWTMPIKNRIDMLTTGIRTPVGVKIHGADIKTIEELGKHVEMAVRGVRGTRSVFAERTGGGYFLDFDWKRDNLARYGLSIDDAQTVVMSAIGGDTVTTTVEGRERYPVNVRYFRDQRSDLESLGRVLVPAMDGRMQVPISQLADLKMRSGPAMLRNENGLLTGYVYIDVADRDIGGYVEEAKRAVAGHFRPPPGYSLTWSGQYEAMERVRERLKVVVPLTLFLIVVLLYLNTGSLVKTMIVLLAVPFSAVGAVWLLDALGYNMSIGVWVGLIALLGVDAETGVFMLLYLDLAYDKARREQGLRSLRDLQACILHGAVKRIRPKFMTVATMFLGLVPIMWSTGAGADVMKRIAAPMIGGIFTSFALELLVYPAIYEVWKWHFELKRELS
jgi:Cu(I)/Ag(I) efflux system membrane protein CusA/SilA